jgi:hypothetical protein
MQDLRKFDMYCPVCQSNFELLKTKDMKLPKNYTTELLFYRDRPLFLIDGGIKSF